MEITKIKTALLSYGLVVENKYLNLYLDLINKNLQTPSDKKINQAHHAIPVSYYQRLYHCKKKNRCRTETENYANADPNNVLVNLVYTDHLLSHCYLALCGKPDWFKFNNANMITIATKDLPQKNF